MNPPNRVDSRDYLLNVDDLAEMLRVSKRTVWRWVEQGRLPAPFRYSRMTVRWRASDIQKHLANKTK